MPVDLRYGPAMSADLQNPLNSGFGMRSTPSEVIAGADLSGKLAVVTGGYSGLGLETTKGLAEAGADVIVPARRPDHAREVFAGLGKIKGAVTVDEMDLGDLASAGGFGERMAAAGRPVDILINNAAIMACPETRIGDGWEAQFATNHLGHFVMTNNMWPVLADGGARVVVLSSTGHKLSDIRYDDPQFNTGYDKWQAYGQAMGWMDADGNLNELFKTPEQGASTSTWAAVSAQLDGLGGVYCDNCDIAPIEDLDSPYARFVGVKPYAVDDANAARLWDLSVELTGVNAFG